MSKKPLVALMQPSAGYGAPHKGAVRGFLRPSLRHVDRIELEQGTTSTPRTFNMLLCDAMNLRRHHEITHLAMIHDDINPDPGWLDTLMDELDRTGADLISAVVPIKSPYGLLSTALETPGDPWLFRRLTLTEAFDLPETFGAEDVPWREPGACLLPNTGLWVARFDGDWPDRFADHQRRQDGQSGFRFLNRIAKAPDGQFVSQDCAEDWDFGRQLRDLGLKTLCTRKVGLEHGLPQWHNRSVWGSWPTDLGFLEFRRAWNITPGVSSAPPGWRFPGDVPGWLSEAEGRALARLAEDKAVLEIGSYCGRSTICLAQTARHVHAVDPFDGRATSDPRKTLTAFMENLISYGVLGRVTACVGTAAEVAPKLESARFDLAFIDGAHDRPSVLRDAGLARTMLNKGGLLAFHDYRTAPGEHDGHWDPGVTEAVGELLSGGCELVERAGTVAVVRPAA